MCLVEWDRLSPLKSPMQYAIKRAPKLGLDCLRIEIELEVQSHSQAAPFIFDTGCEVSIVSEDVAAFFGLPGGGRPVSVRALIAGGAGRIVPVRFRFADVPGVEIDTEWVVVAGRTNVRLLALRDVLPHFEVRTLNMNLYFVPK